MELIQEFLYHVKTTGPLKTTRGSPEKASATIGLLATPRSKSLRIKACIAAPGSDWMRVSDDGFWRPDVRVPFQTDDGETVLMHYTGPVQQTDAFKQAAEANQPTEWTDQYMRLMMHFDTGAERYRWLNTSLFVAKVAYLGPAASDTPSTALRECPETDVTWRWACPFTRADREWLAGGKPTR